MEIVVVVNLEFGPSGVEDGTIVGYPRGVGIVGGKKDFFKIVGKVMGFPLAGFKGS